MIKSLGGRVTGSVSSKTDVLLHGHILKTGNDVSTSTKYKKASTLGIFVIDE